MERLSKTAYASEIDVPVDYEDIVFHMCSISWLLNKSHIKKPNS